MNGAIENINAAMKRAMSIRPKAGGFPYLAETLRRAGVKRNLWALPACQALYLTEKGPVMMQGSPLISGAAEVASFDREALIAALRADQAGKSTFPEFLVSAWKAGVVGYEVDFAARSCTYFGADGGRYVEEYPAVDIG
ncbi:MAG TPA: DUF1398 family protein [Elusimicrobiota bacterium]|nr:DUF1398 family protein [Elusimicrobiota bacterium]